MSVSKKIRSTVSKTRNAPSNAALATQVKSALGQIVATLAAGEPLSTKDRKEVLIRSIRTTPGMVTAAAATYTEHADVLGTDLDPSAALDAQDYIVQLAPIVTELRTLARALEDRLHERDAASSDFAQAVYERAQAMSRMPQGSALGPRITQLRELLVRRRKAKGKEEEAPREATEGGGEPAAAVAVAKGAAPTVVVNTAG